MILGLSVAAFTILHVLISLIGIAAGLVVVSAMLLDRRVPAWTAAFLATTVATSVTGFFFHSQMIGPPHIVGAISLVVLAVALWALYWAHLRGVWRPAYVASAVFALYLNCFVGVVQAFQKLAFLKPLAPTQTEPPFLAAQGTTLLVFVGLGVLALLRFQRPPKPVPAPVVEIRRAA
jgi:hypothetical protein